MPFNLSDKAIIDMDKVEYYICLCIQLFNLHCFIIGNDVTKSIEFDYINEDEIEQYFKQACNRLGYDCFTDEADACPVVRITEQVAKEKGIPVTLLCDTNHVLQSDYSEVITVGAGADAVDFKLVSICQKGDLVVTQDYGVAAMILGKGAYGIHQSGKWYTNENIDQMLMERHLAKKARNAKKKHHLKGPAKRTEEDDRRFEESLRRLIDSVTK